VKSWDPFRDLVSIQDHMNKLFEALLTGPAPLDDEAALGRWQPAVEVLELPDRLEIRCDLPGLERRNVELRWDGGVLVISGERRRPDAPGEWTWHRVERSWGRFSRRFELPPGFEPERAEDRLDQGVLTVIVPRSGEGVSLRARAEAAIDH